MNFHINIFTFNNISSSGIGLYFINICKLHIKSKAQINLQHLKYYFDIWTKIYKDSNTLFNFYSCYEGCSKSLNTVSQLFEHSSY